MKRIVLVLLVSTTLFTACKKSSSSTLMSTSSSSNTITITDGGTNYSVNGPDLYMSTHVSSDNFVNVEIQKGTSSSILTVGNTQGDFKIGLFTENGPANGIGLYTMGKTTGGLTEEFSGGSAYSIDTAAINITTCSASNISGSFTLWLSNSSSSKIVTGIINANQPQVQ